MADLFAAGASVRVVDLRPHPDPSVEIVIGDLAEPAVLAAALDGGFDSIVHLAAVTSVLRSLEHPLLTYRTNVAATAALLEAGRAAGVEALAFASTNAVTGLAGAAAITESATLQPLTPYGSTKAAAEMLMSAYSASYGLRCACLRMTNVYGMGMQAKDSIVARLMRAVRTGAIFEIYGDGRQVRDYVNVSDVVSAFRLALDNEEWAGPVVIGSQESLSVLDVLDAVRRVTGAEVQVRHVEAKAGEMPAVIVDPRKALASGWSPSLRFEDGLIGVWDEWSRADLSAIQMGVPVAPAFVGDGAGALVGDRAALIVADGAAGLVGDGAAAMVGDGTAGLVGDGTAGLAGDGAAAMVGDRTAGLVGDGTAGLVGDGAAGLAGDGAAAMLGDGTAVDGDGSAAMVGDGAAAMVGDGTSVDGDGSHGAVRVPLRRAVSGD